MLNLLVHYVTSRLYKVKMTSNISLIKVQQNILIRFTWVSKFRYCNLPNFFRVA